MGIQLKSVYAKPDAADGKRYLAETFWPLERQTPDLMPYEWVKILVPSFNLTERVRLDGWNGKDFRDAYMGELADARKRSALSRLRREASQGAVTLLYSQKSEENSGAAVLRDVLENRIRPNL